MTCPVTLASRALPGHVHCCGVPLDEHGGNHMCADPLCRRWFGVAS